ncbi:unnamed protein product, partial [Didymodactylos carnosus]
IDETSKMRIEYTLKFGAHNKMRSIDSSLTFAQTIENFHKLSRCKSPNSYIIQYYHDTIQDWIDWESESWDVFRNLAALSSSSQTPVILKLQYLLKSYTQPITNSDRDFQTDDEDTEYEEQRFHPYSDNNFTSQSFFSSDSNDCQTLVLQVTFRVSGVDPYCSIRLDATDLVCESLPVSNVDQNPSEESVDSTLFNRKCNSVSETHDSFSSDGSHARTSTTGATTTKAAATETILILINNHFEIVFLLPDDIHISTNTTPFNLPNETYSEPLKCISSLTTKKQKKIIFIIFDTFDVKNLLPLIHNLKQIIAIYLFQSKSDDNDDEQWYRNYPKVSDIVRNPTELSTSENNEHEEAINRFQDEYTSSQAIQWYIQENSTFIHSSVALAFRSNNITIIYPYRYIIADIYKQIHDSSVHTNNRYNLYKGQQIQIEELEHLKSNIGKLLCTTTFMSVTSSSNSARTNIKNNDDNNSANESILFEILIDIYDHHKPFASITNYLSSRNDNETKYLFQIGTIFRLESIEQLSSQIWYIKLQLTDKEINDSKVLLDLFKNDFGDKLTLWTCGMFWAKVNKCEKALGYYNKLLETSSLTNNQKITVFNNLALIYEQQKKFDMSNDYFTRALELIQSSTPSPEFNTTTKTNNVILKQAIENNSTFSTICYNLGCSIYEQVEHDKQQKNEEQNSLDEKNRYRNALEKFQQALKFIQSSNQNVTKKLTTDQHITTLLENYKCDQDFGVIWLNTSFKIDDEFCLKLKRIFTNLTIFDEPCDAINYFTQNSKKLSYFVCIVSHFNGQHFIPLIHDKSVIRHIYIYCRNSQEQQQWIDKNSENIKYQIFINQNLLIKELKQFTFDANTKQNEGSLSSVSSISFTYFKQGEISSPIRNLDKETIEFIQFQLLIEIILRLSLNEKAKSDMIKACRNYYSNNEMQKKYISVFESNYETKTPLEWYTDPQMKFCHKLTNKALGTQDVDCLFPFRFLIQELHKQLDELHKKPTQSISSPLHRGKLLTANTFQILKESMEGQGIISMNGFVSASVNPNVANMYNHKDGSALTNSNYERVLFLLNVANDKNQTTKPYACLSTVTKIPDEDEVLFSTGTLWLVKSIKEAEKRDMWLVELDLINEENNECCIRIKQYLKEKFEDRTTILTLGNFLSEIDEYEKADRYYHVLLEELPHNHEDRSAIYANIGLLHHKKKNFKVAEEYYGFAYEHFIRWNSTNVEKLTHKPNQDEIMQDCTEKLRSAYSSTPSITSMTIPQTAMKTTFCCHNEINFISTSLVANHSSIGKLYNNLGLLHYSQNYFENAFEYLKQASYYLNETSDAPDLSAVYNNMGIISYKLEKYHDALKYFDKAITTGLMLLSHDHRRIKDYVHNKAELSQVSNGKDPKRQKLKNEDDRLK